MKEITQHVGECTGPIGVTAFDAGGNPTTYNAVTYGSDGAAAEVIDIVGVEGYEDGKYIASRNALGDATITGTVDPTAAEGDTPIIAQLMVHAVAGDAVTAEFNVGGLTPRPIPPGI